MTPEQTPCTEYSLSELLTVPLPDEVPSDFARFWRDTRAELSPASVPWRVTGSLGRSGAHDVTTIEFRSSTGEWVIAWMVLPVRAEDIERGLVVGHGYGGRSGVDWSHVSKSTAAIFPCAPGQPPNAPGRFPAEPDRHVTAGISDPAEYSHRFATADIWRAATVLLEAAPAASRALDYTGGSFGGGIGAMALPWDGRFRRASLDVPSFGNHAIRITRTSEGSSEAIRQLVRARPEVLETLLYFDAATAASHLQMPVHVGAALLDPAVDPRGQFSVYRALAGPKRLTVRPCGHLEGTVAEQADDLVRQGTEDFFSLSDECVSTPVIG